MRPGSALTRLALGVVAVLVVLNALLYGVEQIAGGPDPAGPASSSFATAPGGLAAYADLLVEAGHPVTRLREPLDASPPDPAATLVVLDAEGLPPQEVGAVRAYLEAGGRLVAGGRGTGWLREALGTAPVWMPAGGRAWRPLVPVPETDAIGTVSSAGEGAWGEVGPALPVVGTSTATLLAVASVGPGRALLLADASPLQNRLLADADNAAFGLALAGEPGRTVVFAEAVHGFGAREGFGAIPARWRWTAAGLLLAVLAWMWARGRRLGPPQPAARRLPPPRREYVEAMAALLARSRPASEALTGLRRGVRERILRRSGLGADASAEDIAEAARRAGLGPGEIRAVVGDDSSDEDAFALARALASLEEGANR